MKNTLLRPFYFIALSALVLTACGDGNEGAGNEIDDEVFDPNSSINTVFDGKIFSIPSPIQTAYFIKEMNLPFNEKLLNDDQKTGKYVDEYSQALNLGIYGADLAYSSIYDQKGVTLRYLSAVEKLTSLLGLSSTFDADFMKRFEKNNGNEDSLVILMSDAFSKADNFLKSANRKSTSALVLTGGWLEMIYFATELNANKSSDNIVRRIGEQKETLNSIIAILAEYNSKKQNDELIDQLRSLQKSFEKITINYQYSAPETDSDKQITTFHHTLEVSAPAGAIEEIKTKVKEIRANIIKG